MHDEVGAHLKSEAISVDLQNSNELKNNILLHVYYFENTIVEQKCSCTVEGLSNQSRTTLYPKLSKISQLAPCRAMQEMSHSRLIKQQVGRKEGRCGWHKTKGRREKYKRETGAQSAGDRDIWFLNYLRRRIRQLLVMMIMMVMKKKMMVMMKMMMAAMVSERGNPRIAMLFLN